MASKFTDIVAAKKLASIKKAYKLSEKDEEELSPDEKKKLEKKVEKDQEKQLKKKEKREEQYSDREREREKLRSRLRAKYDLGTEEQQEIGKKKNKKKGELREKDFYKYNKAKPDSAAEKSTIDETDNPTKNGEKSMKFSSQTQELADKKGKGKDDCTIS